MEALHGTFAAGNDVGNSKTAKIFFASMAYALGALGRSLSAQFQWPIRVQLNRKMSIKRPGALRFALQRRPCFFKINTIESALISSLACT
jgi:hypothetical protein